MAYVLRGRPRVAETRINVCRAPPKRGSLLAGHRSHEIVPREFEQVGRHLLRPLRPKVVPLRAAAIEQLRIEADRAGLEVTTVGLVMQLAQVGAAVVAGAAGEARPVEVPLFSVGNPSYRGVLIAFLDSPKPIGDFCLFRTGKGVR